MCALFYCPAGVIYSTYCDPEAHKSATSLWWNENVLNGVILWFESTFFGKKKKKKSCKQNRCFPTEGPRREALSGCNHEYTSTWGCKTRLQLCCEAVADKDNAQAMKLSPAIFDWCLDGVISEAPVLRGSESSDLLSDGQSEID